MRALLVLVLTASFALAGCTSPDAQPLQADDLGGEFVPAAGEPSTHGEAVVTEGDVESSQDGLMWTASKTITIENDAGGASLVDLTLHADAFGVYLTPWDKAGYLVVVTVEAEGLTEQDAEAALDDVEVVHDDSLADGVLTLATQVESRQQDVGPLDISFAGRSHGHIEVLLPSGPGTAFDVHTGSGGIGAESFSGTIHQYNAGSGGVHLSDLIVDTLWAETGSGGISAQDVKATNATLVTGSGGIDLGDVAADTLSTSTGSGGIKGAVIVGDAHFGTGSGGVAVDVTSTRGGIIHAAAGSGGIDISFDTVPGQVFDVTAATGSGGIDIDIPDSQYIDGDEDSNRQVVRSIGYEAGTVQTVVETDTGSGGISVSA